MFSRFIIKGLATVSVLGLILSCAGENEFSRSGFNVSLKDSGAQCLNGFGDRFSEYFEGLLNDRQTEAFWDCAIDSVDMFTNLVKGKEKDSYTAAEIQNFLNRYFMGPEDQIDGEFWASVSAVCLRRFPLVRRRRSRRTHCHASRKFLP